MARTAPASPALVKKGRILPAPAPPPMSLLRQAARRVGIHTSYLDAQGRRQDAGAETLRALLGLWPLPADDERALREALREDETNRGKTWLEPVGVAWDGVFRGAPFRCADVRAGRRFLGRLRCSDGRVEEWVFRPDRLAPFRSGAGTGAGTIAYRLELPSRVNLPLGYHALEVETPSGLEECCLIAAPKRAYSEPEPRKRWGVFAPLYGLRSDESWGGGNLGDWRQFGEWVGGMGGELVATLPLLAAFLDEPFEPSPYSPVTRLFWNEFFLDMEAIPELASCAAARRRLESSAFRGRLRTLRRQPLVDYRAQMGMQREILAMLAEFFFGRPSPRRDQLEQFMRERPRLETYARFRAAAEFFRRPWRTWGAAQREGRLKPGGDFKESNYRRHLYAQWLASEQFGRATKAGMDSKARMYLDLPLGVHPDGYDTWSEQDLFAWPCAVGAPPDPGFGNGQNWGFPPMHPQRLRERRHRYFIEFIRFQMAHTRLLRIDHVMGLHRQYWIPQGFSAAQGAYVRYPAEELHAILTLESHRHHTVLAGENLGTVPPEVDAWMRRCHIRRLFVVQYEQRPDPRRALATPEAKSAASLNTHDMPPFAAHWTGADIRERADLGILPADRVAGEEKGRRRLRTALTRFLRSEGWLRGRAGSARDVLKACLGWLGSSPAEMVVVNLEDLWLEEKSQNVPSTHQQHPNWRRKLRFTLGQIRKRTEARALLEYLHQTRNARDRGGENGGRRRRG